MSAAHPHRSRGRLRLGKYRHLNGEEHVLAVDGEGARTPGCPFRDNVEIAPGEFCFDIEAGVLHDTDRDGRCLEPGIDTRRTGWSGKLRHVLDPYNTEITEARGDLRTVARIKIEKLQEPGGEACLKTIVDRDLLESWLDHEVFERRAVAIRTMARDPQSTDRYSRP